MLYVRDLRNVVLKGCVLRVNKYEPDLDYYYTEEIRLNPLDKVESCYEYDDIKDLYILEIDFVNKTILAADRFREEVELDDLQKQRNTLDMVESKLISDKEDLDNRIKALKEKINSNNE